MKAISQPIIGAIVKRLDRRELSAVGHVLGVIINEILTDEEESLSLRHLSVLPRRFHELIGGCDDLVAGSRIKLAAECAPGFIAAA